MSLKTMRAFSTRLCQSLFAFHNLILYSDVMISVLASSVVDRGLEPRSDQTKDYTIGICCFSSTYAYRSNSEDWLARNRDNVT